ncbi:hypothetical protein SNA_31750 [Streptomyces natalensis ATCC 27448]|uniref:Uncharacterized protein n=1 Tax=Streptomyces natalensis ATCC 27448 TaxID=1240678 RepID=A0A0D7CGX2_9ACTN|nr:hypothetical protein SNA_31750 [Streptomyces natalensis ATCC 27448]
MTFGFAPPPHASRSVPPDSPARLSRMLEPAEWASAGIPLLHNPREIVTGLHDRHRPGPSTAVVAVLDPLGRVAASASFLETAVLPDGWEFRNVLLAHLRRIVPHDLRLRAPVRTAVLLYCREGEPRWTEADGAWMWGLRDACTLHGLRCGAYIALTRDRWQVLGEDRGGRRPRMSRSAGPVPHGQGPRPAEPDRAEPGRTETRVATPRAAAPVTAPPDAASPRTDASPVPPARMSAPRTPTAAPGPRRSGGGARETRRHTAAR